ncbi:hypothetical protein [Serratia ficaria]|uniref:hypothetical protein n=1 Tax=Serratia ficaria TaxID=61651 RepID=UPI00217A5C11|nr:hypothetical protein [Serratia ficaria]CAI1200589.1 Uncharacterised protein [Serratia ficaria]CAI2527519.1 Uncharacterised protein [Serratia ficaria]CAI2536263.1 Uncharacterised protein [Serratia ficaria]
MRTDGKVYSASGLDQCQYGERVGFHDNRGGIDTKKMGNDSLAFGIAVSKFDEGLIRLIVWPQR